MIIDTHCHVIATDTKKYPLKPLFGKQSDWSAEHPLDYPDMVAADEAAGVDKAVLVQASSAYAFDNSYVADSVAAHPERFTGVFSIDVVAPDAVAEDEALDGQGPDRHAHLHLRLDPRRAGDVLRRRGRVSGLAIRQRPGAVGLHADAGGGPAAARNRHQALSRRCGSCSTISPGRRPPTARRSPRPRRCGRWRNIRTSISSSPTGRSSSR